MSLLNDVEDKPVESDYARTLIHGQPGTGKTTLASSMAEVGKMLYMYVPGEEGIGSLKGVEYEENITLHRLGSLTGDPIDEVEKLYWDLYKGDHEYVTVAIDSVSALQTLLFKKLMGLPFDRPIDRAERPATDFAFWGAVRDWFTDFFTFWYGLASQSNTRPIHVVMTSQTKSLDDMEGNERMQPDLVKGGLSSATTRSDQIVYTHMKPDPEDFEKQKPVVRILPSSTIVAKTRCAASVAESLPPIMGLRSRATLPKYLRILKTAGV